MSFMLLRDHISRQYQVRLYDLDNVLTNYEILDKEDKKTVPNTYYENAKAYLEINGSTTQKATETNNSKSKKTCEGVS